MQVELWSQTVKHFLANITVAAALGIGLGKQFELNNSHGQGGELARHLVQAVIECAHIHRITHQTRT
jgi:hypothetical protein